MKFRKFLSISALILLATIGKTQAINHQQTVEPAVETAATESPCSDQSSTFIGNPAAVYCVDVMGYKYQTVTQENGSQKGQCVMPTGEACDQWAFYTGECGANYTYCAQEGYTIETRSDGKDPFAKVYGVCTDSSGRSQLKISDLIHFDTTPLEPPTSEEGSRSDNIPVLSENAITALPSHFDWRDVNGEDWMTPVKNQKSCGSCWAFSAVGVVEPYYNFINANPDLDLNLAEENLVSDCFYRGCNGGWSEDTLEYIRDVGIVDEVCMPYTATDSACATMCDDPVRYSISNVVWDYYTLDVDLLKYYIVNYGPVSVYLMMSGDYVGDIYQCGLLEEWDTNHAVVVAGYDDPGGYWIVKNSWGEDYGSDGGYFKVGYNQCNINTKFYAYLPVLENSAYLPLITTPGTRFTTTPVLTYPVNGAVVNTLKPTMTWQVNDSLNEWAYIYYQVSPDPNFHQYSSGVNGWEMASWGSTVLQENLKENTTYYWHAAYDYLNESDWWELGPYSSASTFTTGSGGVIPARPNLVSPQDEAELANTNVQLEWGAVADADYYEVLVLWEEYYDPYWYLVGAYFITDSNMQWVGGVVEPYSEYMWYVRAVNDYAYGGYSETWTFTTGAQASSTPRSDEGKDYELFIQTKDGEFIPYELFTKNNP